MNADVINVEYQGLPISVKRHERLGETWDVECDGYGIGRIVLRGYISHSYGRSNYFDAEVWHVDRACVLPHATLLRGGFSTQMMALNAILVNYFEK